jgi:hypothetical protein
MGGKTAISSSRKVRGRYGEERLALPFTIQNLEYCFTFGRNYALAATETVRLEN